MKLQGNSTKKLVFTALFIAMGLVLPFATMQVPRIGNMLCPMHIPVLLSGFFCGGVYGLLTGLIVPLLRSMIFGAPPLMPTALAMTFELATYGLVSGVLYKRLSGKKGGIYISLITAMILGRVVWGIAAFALNRLIGNPFTWQIFQMQAFVNAIPGMIVQLILIPALVYRYKAVSKVEAVYEK